MDLHRILAKPIQIVKEVLDLEPDLASPSLASQFVAIKHQLAEVQARLHESNRISREKDVLISKLQKAMAARVEKPPATATLPRREEKPVPAPSVRPPQEAEPDEELKLPAVPSYQAPGPKARPVGTRVAEKTTASPTHAEKTGAEAPSVEKPKKTTRAGKSKTPEKAKPTRARTTAKKPAAKTRAKATAKPKRAPRTPKS